MRAAASAGGRRLRSRAGAPRDDAGESKRGAAVQRLQFGGAAVSLQSERKVSGLAASHSQVVPGLSGSGSEALGGSTRSIEGFLPAAPMETAS